jgi:hypothetical protein
VNGAYQLQNRADTILVSETFFHQTKESCSYEPSSSLVIRGEGNFSTYRLIGMTNTYARPSLPPSRENGLNDKGSLILQKVPVPIEELVPMSNNNPIQETPKKKKKGGCTIL